MARKSKKTELLEIMKSILKEYQDMNHLPNFGSCGLCLKYMDEDKKNSCHDCPMFVFSNDVWTHPCMSRFCSPVDCELTNENDLRLRLVIKFYEKAIAKIESMSTDAVRKSSFKFLIEIDDKLKEKYSEVI